ELRISESGLEIRPTGRPPNREHACHERSTSATRCLRRLLFHPTKCRLLSIRAPAGCIPLSRRLRAGSWAIRLPRGLCRRNFRVRFSTQAPSIDRQAGLRDDERAPRLRADRAGRDRRRTWTRSQRAELARCKCYWSPCRDGCFARAFVAKADKRACLRRRAKRQPVGRAYTVYIDRALQKTRHAVRQIRAEHQSVACCRPRHRRRILPAVSATCARERGAGQQTQAPT